VVSAAVRVHESDPSALLDAAFRRIALEGMAGVPVANPALRVEAVGFARRQGHWLGVLITPWCMNLVLVPGAAAGWQCAAPGRRAFHRFPAGHLAFLGADEPEVGEFRTCALFSTMSAFANQVEARMVAVATLDALRHPPEAADPVPPNEAFGEPERADRARPMSKRKFLERVLGRG